MKITSLFVWVGLATAALAQTDKPVVITQPGPEFRDEVRPGAMIIGMDRTPKGRIWGCWTGTGDKPDTYFILATSDDDGASWTKPRLVVGASDPGGKRQRSALVGNVWTDPLGRVWLFFDQKTVGVEGPRSDWYIRCDNPDAALPVWSEPVRIADEGDTLNKPTILKNGDWLLPVSKWAEKTAWVYASTDQGKSWQPRGHTVFPDWNFDEHMMIELRDGRLWMLARTEGNPYESFSSDKGATWSKPQEAATVKNVNARFFLRRLASGNILLVKNGPTTERLAKRSHMTAYLSADDGQTWKGGLLLDERNGVSYPDGFQSPDGLIHILYDWNRHSDAEILMAKFREEDVLAGKLVSKDAKLLMLANKATGPKPILYNGIELPYEWPPRHLDPNSCEPMPVPYLHKLPKTIPVDVGRQLFVDDFLVEKTDLKRTFHHAEKYEGNPVLKPETPQEIVGGLGDCKIAATACPFDDGVFFDPQDHLFKMFYMGGMCRNTCLATSADGLHWERPKLDVAGGSNVVLSWRPAWARDSFSPWLDLNASNSAERWKAFLYSRYYDAGDPKRHGGSWLYTSPDGIHWQQRERVKGNVGDNTTIFFNPFRQKWVMSVRRNSPERGRARFYFETDEFSNLAKMKTDAPVFWAGTDKLDASDPKIKHQPQLYGLTPVAYESLMLGAFAIHYGPENGECEKGQFPKLTEIELGYSRDGFHFSRPDRTSFIAATKREGDWDRGYLRPAGGICTVVGDKLFFYYCAFSGVAPDGQKHFYAGGSTHVATLRRDGFASMDAGAKTCTLTTRPLRFKGDNLFVNFAAPQGELRVEVLTLEDKTYGGLSAAKCVPLRGDSTRQRVTWNGAENIARAKEKNVKLRFTLTNGSLYSFWITDDKNGASHGYLGTGGPGYSGTRDE